MTPLNLIRQYLFCPRIVYYNLLTDIRPVFPVHVKLGEEYHDYQEALLKNRRFRRLNIEYTEILSGIYLEDEDLQIAGIADLAFLTKDEVIPVEYKHLKENVRVSYGHVLQLFGYGILLSKKYKKEFKRAYVIYGKNLKFYKTDIDTKIEKSFFKTLNAIKEIENSALMPPSSADENKCLQCEYLNFCDDRI